MMHRACKTTLTSEGANPFWGIVQAPACSTSLLVLQSSYLKRKVQYLEVRYHWMADSSMKMSSLSQGLSQGGREG